MDRSKVFHDIILAILGLVLVLWVMYVRKLRVEPQAIASWFHGRPEIKAPKVDL